MPPEGVCWYEILMSVAGCRVTPTMRSTRAADRKRNGLGKKSLRPGPVLAGKMPCYLQEVPVVYTRIRIAHKTFFRYGGKRHDTEVWILKKPAQALRLFPQPGIYDLVDRLRAT